MDAAAKGNLMVYKQWTIRQLIMALFLLALLWVSLRSANAQKSNLFTSHLVPFVEQPFQAVHALSKTENRIAQLDNQAMNRDDTSLFVPLLRTPEIPPLLVADFDTCHSPNNLGGEMGAAYNYPSDFLLETYVLISNRGCVANLEYEITDWAAFWLKLEGVDLSPYNTLTFDIRTLTPNFNGQYKLELNRANDSEISVRIFPHTTSDWETLSFLLEDFEPPLSSWADMEELVLTFEAALAGNLGTVQVDNILFENH